MWQHVALRPVCIIQWHHHQCRGYSCYANTPTPSKLHFNCVLIIGPSPLACRRRCPCFLKKPQILTCWSTGQFPTSFQTILNALRPKEDSNLGVIFDQEMSSNSHVKQISEAAIFILILTLLHPWSLCALSSCRSFQVVVGTAAVVLLDDSWATQDRRSCDFDPRISKYKSGSLHFPYRWGYRFYILRLNDYISNCQILLHGL